jgi:hypothetical protein
MPRLDISNKFTGLGYVNSTNAKLTIMSVPTSNVVAFPAFLTDFSQTFDATWNTEDVFGRMDPIATYQGTKRTMSLGFDVPAGTAEEAKHNLETCALLTTMVYPIYNDIGNAQVLAKPPLVRINFANLIAANKTLGTIRTGDNEQEEARLNNLKAAFQEQDSADWQLGDVESNTRPVIDPLDGLLGWISNLSWKPNLEMGMFAKDGKFYPKIVSISFSFNILHEKVLDQSSLANTNWPFGD